MLALVIRLALFQYSGKTTAAGDASKIDLTCDQRVFYRTSIASYIVVESVASYVYLLQLKSIRMSHKDSEGYLEVLLWHEYIVEDEA